MKRINAIPLIVEPYPEDYGGYPFITLIRYNDENLLNIVDNVHDKQLSTYVLDFCSAASINEDMVIEIALNWVESGNNIKHPISVEFSKLNMSERMSAIMRVFPVDYISRVIGPLPTYQMSGTHKVRKRKRKPIPDNVEFTDRRILKI